MDTDRRLLDVYREKPVRLTVRIAVPVKEHPKVRFSLPVSHAMFNTNPCIFAV